MLGPLLRSSHLGWFEKGAAVIELTMPATLTLFATYLVLIVIASVRLPDLLVRNEYFFFYSNASCLAVATVALVTQALGPFLLRMVPWAFATSLFFLPYFAIWKTVISLRGAPRSWLRTTREPATRNGSESVARHVS